MLWLCGCDPPATAPQAIAHGLDFLESQQESDGAWRSKLYRDMAGGYELTPMVAKALLFSGRTRSAQKAIDFVNAGLDQKKTLVYPVYTGAEMLLLLSRSPDPVHQKAWKDLLLGYQLGTNNGWSAADPDFGGWGYAMHPPRKGGKDPMAHSNLTSTTFALGALRVASLEAGEGAVVAGKTFVLRCQARDGGFFATPGPDVLNKAGPGVSYGSATADGVRCLLRCGLSPADEPVKRAADWLVTHFDPLKVSGDFPAARYEDRDSLYFYYLWSSAHALSALDRAGQHADRSALARALTEQLLKIQLKDGSWRNSLGATREDDPLVATSMALAALSLCQAWR